MMKHKKMLVFTSILIVLPVVAGLLLWGQLPEKMREIQECIQNIEETVKRMEG